MHFLQNFWNVDTRDWILLVANQLFFERIIISKLLISPTPLSWLLCFIYYDENNIKNFTPQSVAINHISVPGHVMITSCFKKKILTLYNQNAFLAINNIHLFLNTVKLSTSNKTYLFFLPLCFFKGLWWYYCLWT